MFTNPNHNGSGIFMSAFITIFLFRQHNKKKNQLLIAKEIRYCHPEARKMMEMVKKRPK